MAGLDPPIHDLISQVARRTWMAGTSPGHDEEWSLHRRVDQVPQHRAEILALPGALHHEHAEQLFGGIDEEERSGHSAPEELTARSRERRHAFVGANGEAEPKAVTGRHQRRVDLD